MWQIFVEAIVSPHGTDFSNKSEFSINFDLGLAIRGKNTYDDEWNTIYSSFDDPNSLDLSTVSVSCDIDTDSDTEPDHVCDSFEVGIIGHLDYQMYDIAVMITDAPDDLLGKDYANINFRLSHVNDGFMNWFATIRLVCLLITSLCIVLYFVTSCGREGFNALAFTTFNLDQYWVISLLLLCFFYNEPLFELRRDSPSVTLAVMSEIPASLFLSALLTYWLVGLTLVRVRS